MIAKGKGMARMMDERATAGGALAAVFVILLFLVVAVGVAGFALYNQATELKTKASDVGTEMSQLSDKVAALDFEGVGQTGRTIARNVDDMNNIVQGPLWSIASVVPFVGTDVSNVRALVGVLKNITDKGVEPTTTAASQGDLFALVDALVALDGAVEEAKTTLAALPQGVIPEVNNTIAQAKEYMEKAPTFSNLTQGALTFTEDTSSAAASAVVSEAA